MSNSSRFAPTCVNVPSLGRSLRTVPGGTVPEVRALASQAPDLEQALLHLWRNHASVSEPG